MIKSRYLIIDIIPLIRLPSNAPDLFSYFFKKKIKRGCIVEIEFKKRKIYGYVFNIESTEKRRALLKEEKLQLKPVLRIVNFSPLITSQQIQLAFWVKNYSNISLATALSLFFPYKKMITFKAEHTELTRNKRNQHGRIGIKTEESDYSQNDFVPSDSSLSISVSSVKKFEVQVLSQLNKDILKNKKTLIVVPQEDYLEHFKKIIPKANLILPQQKSFFSILEKIIGENKETFIGNKNSIFLPWQNLDQLIVYDEGSIFYKEFFKPPYIDYRKIFLKFAEIHKIKYIAVAELPSFELLIHKLITSHKLVLNSPQFAPGLDQFVSFERISEKEFENKIEDFKKIIIFVPEKSFGYRLVCESCFQALICNSCSKFLAVEENFVYCPYCLYKKSLPEICSSCKKKSNFLISHKGAKAIYKLLLTRTNAENTQANADYTQTYAEKTCIDNKRKVYFLEKEDKKIIKSFNQEKEGILIGSLLLLNPLINNFDAFFFYNFDEFYFANDFFLKEKFVRILNFFKNKTEKIFLIGNVINPQIEAKIKSGDILNELIQERKINNLPPFKRLVVLKEGSINLAKLQQKLFNIKEKIKKENPQLEIFGPIFARPFKIKKRFFLELILKIEPKINFNLRKILKEIKIEEIDCDALSY